MTTPPLDPTERRVLELFDSALRRRTQICTHCGVRYGLHQYVTFACPPFDTSGNVFAGPKEGA